MLHSYPGTARLAQLTVQRLAELNTTRARVEALESRAGAMVEAESVRRHADYVSALQYQYSALQPELYGLQHSVAELKAYLQGVYDADLLGESSLVEVAMGHAVHYAFKLLESAVDDAHFSTFASSLGVLEVASSAVLMFSQRPGGAAAVVNSNGMPVLVKLLSPVHNATVISNIANAIGNMAGSVSLRLAFRASGGIGALVRLLRPDVASSVQTSGAAALSLLAAQDIVIQDSARYLGAIESLVGMLAEGDSYAVEVAKYALQSLRYNNVKNQADIITALRSSPSLAKDVLRLSNASELLRFQELSSQKAAMGLYSDSRSSSDAFTTPTRMRPPPAYITANPYIPTSPFRPFSASPPRSPRSPTRPHYLTSPTSPYAFSSPSSPFSSIVHTPLPMTDPRRYVQPPVTYRKTYYDSLIRPSGLTSSLLSPARIARYGMAAGQSALGYLGLDLPSYSYEESLYRLGVVPEMSGDLQRRRHLSRYTVDELALLLHEFGFDRLDLRPFKIHRVTGQDLLDMTEDDMFTTLVLPRARVGTLRTLQRAVQLFDRITTLPCQGKFTETELRLYLASNGCNFTDAEKLATLFKSLVRTERHEFVTFFDFVRSYDWIAQAFKIYNIPA